MGWKLRRTFLPVEFAGVLIPMIGVVATLGILAQHREASGPLHARVEAYEDAWNRHDASELAGFFAPHADMIMGSGPRIVGREAIRDWWGGYFDRIVEERKGTFVIVSVRLIGDNVALLNVASTTAGRTVDGQRLATRRARGTWVVARETGEWLIVAMRGQPAEGELRSSPGTDKERDGLH